MGLGFLADHTFERAFVVFAVVLGITSLSFGFRRHHRLTAFLFLIPGVALLVLGVLIDLDHTGSLHALLVSIGGVLVMCAHVANLRLAHAHIHNDNCCAPSALP